MNLVGSLSPLEIPKMMKSILLFLKRSASFRNSDNRISIQQFNIVYSCVFMITSFDITVYEINSFTNAFSAVSARGAESSIS